MDLFAKLQISLYSQDLYRRQARFVQYSTEEMHSTNINEHNFLENEDFLMITKQRKYAFRAVQLLVIFLLKILIFNREMPE